MKLLKQSINQINGVRLSVGDFVASDLPYDEIHGVITNISQEYGVLCIYVQYVVNNLRKIRVYHNAESLVRVY